MLAISSDCRLLSKNRSGGNQASARFTQILPARLPVPPMLTVVAGLEHPTLRHGSLQYQKSVDSETLRHSERMRESASCLASMAATVSLPSGRRTGGFGSSAKATSTSASLEGSPGWLWLRPPATARTFPAVAS